MSQVTGLTRQQHVNVRDALSYQVPSGKVKTKFKDVDGRKVKVQIPEMMTLSLLSKRGGFPTGCLDRVENCLSGARIKYVTRDTRIRPVMGKRAGEFHVVAENFNFLEWQGDCAIAAVEGERGICSAPTGTGKSIAAAMIAAAFGVKTLIVVPSLTLKKQLTATFNWMFGLDTAGPLLNRSAKFLVTIENIDALRVTDDLTGVDLLIIDEFHHSAAATYRILNTKLWKTIYWRIGMTATNFRSRDAEAILMESVLSRTLYTLPYKKAVADGLISPLKVYYVDAPKLPKTVAYDKYHDAYREIVIKNQPCNEMIAHMTATLYDRGKSTLVLCRQIDHGNAIREILSDRGYDVPFAEGKSDLKDFDIDNFCKQLEPALIGTVGVLGEGVDTKPAEYGIIAGGGKAKVQLMQNLGRLFRTFPGKEHATAILVKYSGNKWLENHFKECCEHIMEEYGVEVLPLPSSFFTE